MKEHPFRTFLKILNSTNSEQKLITNLFLFSLAVLSICIYRFSGQSFRESTRLRRTLKIRVIVRLLSWGNCKRSTKAKAILLYGHFVCTRTPVTCVRSFHKLDCDFAISLVCDRFVLAWSIPSIIKVICFCGSQRDFSLWLWYFLLSVLERFINDYKERNSTYSTLCRWLWSSWWSNCWLSLSRQVRFSSLSLTQVSHFENLFS